jgi:hypothetical protein
MNGALNSSQYGEQKKRTKRQEIIDSKINAEISVLYMHDFMIIKCKVQDIIFH